MLILSVKIGEVLDFRTDSLQSVIQYEYLVDSKSITLLFTYLKDTVKPKIPYLNLTSYLIRVGVKENREIERRYRHSSFLICGLVPCPRRYIRLPSLCGPLTHHCLLGKGEVWTVTFRASYIVGGRFNHSLVHILKFGLQP